MHVRSLFAVVLAALLAGPATAHAQAKKSTAKAAAPAKSAPAATATSPNYSVAGWIGYEMGDLDGLQLRVDGILPYKKLNPQIALSWVGSVGYSYLKHSVTTGIPGFQVSTDSTAHLLKLVPAARFTYPVNPALSLFGDAGLGLYYSSVSTDADYGGGVVQSASSSSLGFMFRFGVGGLYQINPQMNVGASLMLDPMLGDYEDTTFTILAGLTYKL